MPRGGHPKGRESAPHLGGHVAPLAAYCAAYARWRTAEETLARMAENDAVTLLIDQIDDRRPA